MSLGLPLLLCFAPPLAYVLSLYVVPPARVRLLPRSAREHVLWRFAAVAAACALAPLPLLWLRPGPVWRLLGAAPACSSSPFLLAWPLLVTAALFFGPLAAAARDCSRDAAERASALTAAASPGESPRLTAALRLRGLAILAAAQDALRPRSETEPLLLARALVVAPLSEEWVFRACVVPLAALSGAGAAAVVGLTCSAFAVAHAHHYVEHRRGGMAHAAALRAVILQLSYTSVFGALEAVLFLQTGSFPAIVVPHVFCNFVGMPRLPSNRRGAAAFATGLAACAVLLYVGPEAVLGPDAAPCALRRLLRDSEQ